MRNGETEDKSDLLETALDKILEVSKTSYDQESERNKQLLTKSDYLIKYISAIFIFINIFLPLAFQNKIVNLKVLVFMYIFVCIPVLICLFFCIRAQVLRSCSFFPTGKETILEMKKNSQDFNSEIKIKNKHISYFSSSTKSLEESNNTRSELLKKAYWAYFSSIGAVFFIIFIIMILIA